jgi:RNA polymerase sigma-70 factor (ECF subfamily)
LEELVKQAQKGDNDSFDKLIQIIKKELYLIAKTRLNSEDDIADCMQDTILNAYQNIHKLHQVKYFKTWIIRILINECNKINKKNKDSISLESEVIDNITSSNFYDSGIQFDSIISSLNKDEQLILTLYYVSGYTVKEISKIIKMNENTIKTKMKRAKEKLKNKYEGGDY